MPHLDRTNSTDQVVSVLTIVTFETQLLLQDTQAPLHFLLALMVRPDANAASRLLARYTTDIAKARRYVKGLQAPHEGEIAVMYLTASMRRVYDRALEIANHSDTPTSVVRTIDVLQAIIEESDPVTDTLFTKLGVYKWDLYRALKGHVESDD